MRAARTAARLGGCLIRQRTVYSPGLFALGDSAAILNCRGFATLPNGDGLPSSISGPVKKLLEPLGPAETAPLAAPAAAKFAQSDNGNSINAVNVVDQAAADSIGAGTTTSYDAAYSVNSTGAPPVDVSPQPHNAADAAFATDNAFSSTSAETVQTAAEASAAVDPATAAQVADAAASAGFSLSDTLLQPTILLLNTVHDFSGLPWWMSIGLATIAVRTAILPLTVMTMKNSAKMAALQPEIAVRRDAIMDAMRTGDQKKATVKQEEVKKFMKAAGVAPSKMLLGPISQFPIFISFFVGVRRLALNEPSLTTGGAYWFPDLSIADPVYALPLLCGISLAAMTELGGDAGGAAKVPPMMRNALRAMAVLSVPLTYWFPAGVFCYWIPNNLYSICFALATRSEAVKAKLGMNVDLAKIPGTKEYARAMRQNKFAAPVSYGKLASASPAASYMMKKTIDVESVKIPVNEKHVLFRQKPVSKKTKKKRNTVH